MKNLLILDSFFFFQKSLIHVENDEFVQLRKVIQETDYLNRGQQPSRGAFDVILVGPDSVTPVMTDGREIMRTEIRIPRIVEGAPIPSDRGI